MSLIKPEIALYGEFEFVHGKSIPISKALRFSGYLSSEGALYYASKIVYEPHLFNLMNLNRNVKWCFVST